VGGRWHRIASCLTSNVCQQHLIPLGNWRKASATIRGPFVQFMLWGFITNNGNNEEAPMEYIVQDTRELPSGSDDGISTSALLKNTEGPGLELENKECCMSGLEIDTESLAERTVDPIIQQEYPFRKVGDFFPDWEHKNAGAYWADVSPGIHVHCLLVGKDDKLTHQRAVVFGKTGRGFERLGVLWYKSYEDMLKRAEMKTAKLVKRSQRCSQ
jgi:hypothetical protein